MLGGKYSLDILQRAKKPALPAYLRRDPIETS